ncbi:MAG: hypothetical protein CMN56_10230 [Sneathiella sp.]|uniref:hypothetical protein n=1 Tax=Sneathiella sp. TaxID=1964365 RepID=UPI000C3B06B0|nr:hypothetical protein [Sneathiella sp.]MAZ03505.1 hypothetical protein [Sneathiella sp.]
MKDTVARPSKQVFIKFFLLLALLGGYFAYLSYEFDLLTGGVSALLTWSFFVLCTPIADAGFLLDFPLRLLFGIRMILSELAVWTIAILVNVFSLSYAASYYDTTLITKLLRQIIITPYPYWGVIVLSGIGTFLSIRFGDELMDVIHHRDRRFFHSHQFKHELVLVAFFFVAIFGYYELIKSLNLEGSF